MDDRYIPAVLEARIRAKEEDEGVDDEEDLDDDDDEDFDLEDDDDLDDEDDANGGNGEE